jgi:uncharacterized protein YndB with AHSA1/START domain
MIDVNQYINGVRRTVGDRTIEAGEARVSTISRIYPTDVDDLWEAVSSAERIGRWFLPISGELKEGGHYQLEGNASGTISRCDKPHGYSATWEYHDAVSWIEVRLTPEGDGTRFELEHVGQVPEGALGPVRARRHRCRLGPRAVRVGAAPRRPRHRT